MSKILGICVSSDKHLDKIIRLCRAAKKRGVEVHIFFTHIGTRLCSDPRFKELESLAKMALCRVSFESNELEKPVLGIAEKGYSSQTWHADMAYGCDRYLTF